jgi:hypothetical protein
MRKTFLAMALALSLLLLGAGQALAATTRVVDKDGMATPSNCNSNTPTPYTTIQSAVDASGPNDTIKVCPATYSEQVRILGSTKNGITLTSTTRRAAVIQAPPTFDRNRPDLVSVEQARGVSIQRFTISGPIPDTAFCNELLVSGVRVKDNGSAKLTDNRITEIRSASPALRGCQNGFAVAVGRKFEPDPTPTDPTNTTPTTGDANLFLNQIDKYQKGGVYADNEGTALNMTGNAVLGDGPNTQIGQNGVQISRGADAFVGANLVQDNTYTNPVGPGQASGFILFRDPGDTASNLRLSANLARRNDTNIALFDIDRGTFENNRALDATFYDGIFVDEFSTGNRFEDNRAFGNPVYDCEDDSTGHGTAGTANTWKDNQGKKSSPPHICRSGKRDRHDDDWDD